MSNQNVSFDNNVNYGKIAITQQTTANVYQGEYTLRDQEILFQLVENNDCFGLSEKLKPNFKIEIQSKNGESLLHRAVLQKNVDIVNLLIEKYHALNVKDSDEDTPLNVASLKGYSQIASILIENGADADCKNKERKTPVYYAACHNDVDLITLLHSKGAYLNIQDTKGLTPLIRTLFGIPQEDAAKALINLGANIWITAKNGWTPLHYACFGGLTNIVKLLIENGARLEAPDIIGQQPLHVAARTGNEKIVQILIEKGVDINAMDEENNTPLHEAAGYGRISVVEILLKRGAKPFAKNNEGWFGKTPLDVCRSKKSEIEALYKRLT